MKLLDRLVKIIMDRKSFAGTGRTWRSKFCGFNLQVGEALRKWYSKLRVLFVHKKKYRRAVAVDETKVKLENQ